MNGSPPHGKLAPLSMGKPLPSIGGLPPLKPPSTLAPLRPPPSLAGTLSSTGGSSRGTERLGVSGGEGVDLLGSVRISTQFEEEDTESESVSDNRCFLYKSCWYMYVWKCTVWTLCRFEFLLDIRPCNGTKLLSVTKRCTRTYMYTVCVCNSMVTVVWCTAVWLAQVSRGGGFKTKLHLLGAEDLGLQVHTVTCTHTLTVQSPYQCKYYYPFLVL